MSIELKVPVLPESVADATVATWHKKPGDFVKQGENLVDIETDKVMLELPAPSDGVLESIIKGEGETVLGQEVIGQLKEGAAAQPQAAAAAAPNIAASSPAPAVQAGEEHFSPAVRRALQQHGISGQEVSGTGKGGRVTKMDVDAYVEKGSVSTTPAPSAAPVASAMNVAMGSRVEERVAMTRLRARVAERLVEAQHEAAILTTFNEVNLGPVSEMRTKYKDAFEKKHGVRLGFMSFFVRASVEALKRFPIVNASVDGQDILYHGYFDIGIAVSSPRGLVVPVLRDADQMGMADIEKNIREYGQKAKDAKLTMEELSGGTFTITNGGVFGSLLSTPILNPPQSAILGMHKIEDRPVVENGEIVIRPMMYLALSYDHRIIDGRDSVQFLVTIKELLEDPARLLLDL